MFVDIFPWVRFGVVRVALAVLLVTHPLSLTGCGAMPGAPAGQDAGRADEVSSARPANRTMAMGTNLDGLAYWNSGLPTLDLMKSAGRWLPQNANEYDTGEPLTLDGQGWVAQVAPASDGQRYDSVLVTVLHDNPAAPPGMRYVVLYDGEGTVSAVPVDGERSLSSAPGRLTLAAGKAGSLYLRVGAAADGTPATVRNIRVVREDMLPLYNAGLSFNPEFIARIADFQLLRFMDWMNSNAVFDRSGTPLTDTAIDHAPTLRWADRAKPGDMRWGDGSRGVPVEMLVELANRVGADPWFNMPVNASDDYVREFARYVRDHLSPDLRVHVEFSNEVWKHGLSAIALCGGAGARGVRPGWRLDGMVRHACRANRANLERGVREPEAHRDDPGRVSIVYNTQFGWKGLEANGLDTVHWRGADDAHVRASDYFDEYAITGYYDGAMNGDAVAPAVEAWWRDADGGFGRAIAALRERITGFNAPLYRYHAEQAAGRACGWSLMKAALANILRRRAISSKPIPIS